MLHELFQRRRGRESESQSAGAIDGDGPVVHDALDAGVEGIDDRAELQAAFRRDFAEDRLGELRGDTVRGQADGAVIAEALGGRFVRGDERLDDGLGSRSSDGIDRGARGAGRSRRSAARGTCRWPSSTRRRWVCPVG